MERSNAVLGALAVTVAVLLAGALATGCTPTATAPVKSGPTALGGLAAAQSALVTMAPDAKLLVVQTAEAVEATATPVWAYLFGSPSSDKTYIVYVANGQVMGAEEYGSAGLSTTDWAKVPGTAAWKVDSDVAYKNALAISGAKSAPASYLMGMLTFKPTEDTSTVRALVWNVAFEPGSSGATTRGIEVDATTGKATLSP